MYLFVYEKAIADVEKAVIESLEKQYAEVLSPLKETVPMKFGLKYVQKFAKGHPDNFIVSSEVQHLLSFSDLYLQRFIVLADIIIHCGVSVGGSFEFHEKNARYSTSPYRRTNEVVGILHT